MEMEHVPLARLCTCDFVYQRRTPFRLDADTAGKILCLTVRGLVCDLCHAPVYDLYTFRKVAK